MVFPENVQATLERLRTEHQPYLVIRKINRRYYVYQDKRPWDKEKKKQTTISKYLGRITEDGLFIMRAKSANSQLENAKAVILAHGGKVILPEYSEEGKEQKVLLTPNEIDNKILTILSMNAKASYNFIGKLTGMTASAACSRVRKLEKQYGIKYLAELDMQKLGYLGYIAFVKFLDDKIPSSQEMTKVFENEPMIQLALMTKGEFDLVLYILSKDNRDEFDLFSRIQYNTVFKDYNFKWFTNPEYDAYSFIPVRTKMFESIEKDILKSSRKKDQSKILPYRELLVMKELSTDGAVELSQIDIKNTLDKGASQYAYYSLLKKQIIKRITITETVLPIKYNSIIFTEIFNGKNAENMRPWFLSHIISETKTPINKYLFIATTTTPLGGMLIFPSFDQADLQKNVEELKNRMKGVDVKFLTITGVLLGAFCYRKFDNDYSRQYDLLTNTYKTLKTSDKTSYIEKGRT